MYYDPNNLVGRGAYFQEQCNQINSLDDLHRAYQGWIGWTYNTYDAALNSITNKHDQAFATELERPGSGDITRVMGQTKQAIGFETESVAANVNGFMGAVRDRIRSMYPGIDTAILEDPETIRTGIHGNQWTQRVVDVLSACNAISRAKAKRLLSGQGSYDSELDLMRIFPYSVQLEDLQRKARVGQLDSGTIFLALEKFTPFMRPTFNALFDADIYRNLLKTAESQGAGSDRSLSLLKAASNIGAWAMRHALDAYYMHDLEYVAQRHGRTSEYGNMILRLCSSSTVAEVFRRRLL